MSTVKATNIQNGSSSVANAVTTSGGDLTNAAGVSFMGGSKNLLYNGAMQVAQRGTSTAGITVDSYNTADRWKTGGTSLGTWTQSIEADGPTGSGLTKSLKMLCTTANASPGANSEIGIVQAFEGQNLQRIAKGTAAAKTLTLSFWVKSNVTGTYIVELMDDDNSNRHVSKSYVVSASATWEFKTLTFPADTTGVFDNDNNGSMRLHFWMGAGSNYNTGTLQTSWGALNQAGRAVGQVNVAAATSNYWQVTGVQLEVGPVASSFEFKSYGQELAECQRYCQLVADGISLPIGIAAYYNSTRFDIVLDLPVQMRTAPTLSITSGSQYYYVAVNNVIDHVDDMAIAVASNSRVQLINNTQASATGGQSGHALTNNAASKILFLAEL